MKRPSVDFSGALKFGYNVTFWAAYPTMFGVLVVAPALGGVYGQGLDPLLWRTFGNHHTVILFALAGAAFYMVRYMKLDRVLTMAGVAAVIALYEIPWWVTAIIRYNASDWLFTLGKVMAAWYMPLCIVICIFYFRCVGVPWRFIGAVCLFMAGWFAIGFPVSELWGFQHGTGYYAVPWVNGLEIFSHLYAIGAWIILEKGGMRIWQKKVDKGSNLIELNNRRIP